MMNNIPNREGTDRININKNKEGTKLKNLMQGPPLAFSDGQDKKEEGKEGRRKKIRSSFERYLNELNYHITHIKKHS